MGNAILKALVRAENAQLFQQATSKQEISDLGAVGDHFQPLVAKRFGVIFQELLNESPPLLNR